MTKVVVKNSLFRYEKSFKSLCVAISFSYFAVEFLDFVKMSSKGKKSYYHMS